MRVGLEDEMMTEALGGASCRRSWATAQPMPKVPPGMSMRVLASLEGICGGFILSGGFLLSFSEGCEVEYLTRRKVYCLFQRANHSFNTWYGVSYVVSSSADVWSMSTVRLVCSSVSF